TEPRGPFRGAAARGGRFARRARLRARAGRDLLPAPARAAGARGGRERCGDHRGLGPGERRARAHHRRHGHGHGAGLGDRGRGRRRCWRCRGQRPRTTMTPDLVASLYVLLLAGFVGFEVIRRVSPLLHTPLMSLTNALSAIAVVGAIIIAGEQRSTLTTVLGT